MKRLLMMMVALIAFFTFCSCTESKESYIKDFTKFVEKVQTNAQEYSETEWKEMNKKYEEFAETKYKKYSAELSTEEMIGLTKLKATYLAIQAKHGILNNLLEEGNKALDGLMK